MKKEEEHGERSHHGKKPHHKLTVRGVYHKSMDGVHTIYYLTAFFGVHSLHEPLAGIIAIFMIVGMFLLHEDVS